MDCLQTLTKQHLGYDLGDQSEFDLYLYLALTVKVKLVNLATIEITYKFTYNGQI